MVTVDFARGLPTFFQEIYGRKTKYPAKNVQGLALQFTPLRRMCFVSAAFLK